MFLANNKRFNIFHVITYFELQSKVNIFQVTVRQIGLPQIKVVGIIILKLLLVLVVLETALEECKEAFRMPILSIRIVQMNILIS